MIPNEETEEWHYLALSKLSALLNGTTSKRQGDFYCLNYLHCFRKENKLKSHEKICKNKDFCRIVIPSEKNNVLEINQYMKSDKMPCIIYADIESLIKKIDGWANIPQNPSTTKLDEHIPCGYSISTIWALTSKIVWQDCVKKFCTFLREHATNVINFEKKKMLYCH